MASAEYRNRSQCIYYSFPVIAQLFRLSSSQYTIPNDFGKEISNLTDSPASSIPSAEIPQVLTSLLAASERQEKILSSLQSAQANEKGRYARLGRPVGATFLMISVVLVLLGAFSYRPLAFLI